MVSTVYFLPWSRVNQFSEWIRTIGAFNHIKEREFVGIKIHFGEEGNKGYIRPEMVKPVAEQIKAINAWPFLTDANTIYVGQRADAVHHSIVAANHGFTVDKAGCPVIIADGLRGNTGIDVEVNLKHFKHVSIANAVFYADSLLIMSHFKGHEITGFGGALKNIGMGCGTRAGKYSMHDRVHPMIDYDRCMGCGHCVKWCSAHALEVKGNKIHFNEPACVGCGECILSCPINVFHIPWDEKTSDVQEKIVEYVYGTLKNKSHFSINFLNNITQYCDCYPSKGASLLPDIGIMASSDPVALDHASAEMVNKSFVGDFWKHIFPEIDWRHQLEYAEKLGLGSRDYRLVTAE